MFSYDFFISKFFLHSKDEKNRTIFILKRHSFLFESKSIPSVCEFRLNVMSTIAKWNRFFYNIPSRTLLLSISVFRFGRNINKRSSPVQCRGAHTIEEGKIQRRVQDQVWKMNVRFFTRSPWLIRMAVDANGRKRIPKITIIEMNLNKNAKNQRQQNNNNNNQRSSSSSGEKTEIFHTEWKIKS